MSFGVSNHHFWCWASFLGVIPTLVYRRFFAGRDPILLWPGAEVRFRFLVRTSFLGSLGSFYCRFLGGGCWVGGRCCLLLLEQGGIVLRAQHWSSGGYIRTFTMGCTGTTIGWC